MSRQWTQETGGVCSFCGKAVPEVRRLYGTAGRACRICDECVATGTEIVSYTPYEPESSKLAPPDPSAPYVQKSDADREAFHVRLEATLTAGNQDTKMVELLRGRLDQRQVAAYVNELVCSFCDALPAARYDLFPALHTKSHICARCLADANAIVSGTP
jgi:hypothetical protein